MSKKIKTILYSALVLAAVIFILGVVFSNVGILTQAVNIVFIVLGGAGILAVVVVFALLSMRHKE